MLGEKEESQIFLVLPGGLTGFCCTSRGNGTTWEPRGPGHFRFVPALEGGGFSQPHTPNLLGYLMKQNHYRSLWQLEPHRFKAKWYLLGKTLVHFIAAGALCSGRGAVHPGWERTWLWGWWNHLFHTLSSWQPTTKPEEKWWLFKWKQNITFLTSSTGCPTERHAYVRFKINILQF